MNDYKFCPICGEALEWSFVEGCERQICKSCRRISYRNPIPVVCCLVKNSRGELLFVKRGVEPGKGKWALPGGFIESGEKIEEAGCRELLEETGLKGEPGRLIGVETQKSEMYGPLVVVGQEFLVDNEDITVGDDAAEAGFFPENKLPDIPFEAHHKLTQMYIGLS